MVPSLENVIKVITFPTSIKMKDILKLIARLAANQFRQVLWNGLRFLPLVRIRFLYAFWLLFERFFVGLYAFWLLRLLICTPSGYFYWLNMRNIFRLTWFSSLFLLHPFPMAGRFLNLSHIWRSFTLLSIHAMSPNLLFRCHPSFQWKNTCQKSNYFETKEKNYYE